MKAYAQYFTRNLKQEITEALGSDGILPLDARFSVNNLAWQAIEKGKQLNTLGKGFVAVEIRRGNLKHYRIVGFKYFDNSLNPFTQINRL
jgi:hypothetical protein